MPVGRISGVIGMTVVQISGVIGTTVVQIASVVTFVEFASKFCVKVSQVVYISATTYQKAFIFRP